MRGHILHASPPAPLVLFQLVSLLRFVELCYTLKYYGCVVSASQHEQKGFVFPG